MTTITGLIEQLLPEYLLTGNADPFGQHDHDLFNQLAPDLPGLFWMVYEAGLTFPTEVRGQVLPGTDGTEAAAVLTAWAERLGLTLDTTQSVDGMREYNDHRIDRRLAVWGVVDREQWRTSIRQQIYEQDLPE